MVTWAVLEAGGARATSVAGLVAIDAPVHLHDQVRAGIYERSALLAEGREPRCPCAGTCPLCRAAEVVEARDAIAEVAELVRLARAAMSPQGGEWPRGPRDPRSAIAAYHALRGRYPRRGAMAEAMRQLAGARAA